MLYEAISSCIGRVGVFTRLGLEKLAQDTCQSMNLTRKAGALNRISMHEQGYLPTVAYTSLPHPPSHTTYVESMSIHDKILQRGLLRGRYSPPARLAQMPRAPPDMLQDNNPDATCMNIPRIHLVWCTCDEYIVRPIAFSQ